MNTEANKRLECAAGGNAASVMSSADWQARYDEGKTGWDRGEPGPMLQHWLTSGQLQPCKILVPGCGRGHEVVALAERGFDVTAIDFADAAVQALTDRLRQLELKANVVQSDILTFCRQNRFDAIYEQTCLCALNPSQWPAYVQLLANWLNPGGKLLALFMQATDSNGPPFHCDLATMHQLFDDSNWIWDASSERVAHPMGLHEVACIITRRLGQNRTLW